MRQFLSYLLAMADRAARLLEIEGLLFARSTWTASELADAVGVSQRTLQRDLVTLEQGGLPLEAERGRGGGVRLLHSAAPRRLQLSEQQLLDVLLALAVAEHLHSPLLLESLRSVRRALTLTFPRAKGAAIAALRQRVLVGAPASATVRLSYGAHPPAAVVRPLQEAFVGCRRLEVHYAGAAGPARRRHVEPHALLFNAPIWYVLGRDVEADAARTFRLDRIQRARCLNEPFVVVAAATLLAEADVFFAPV